MIAPHKKRAIYFAEVDLACDSSKSRIYSNACLNGVVAEELLSAWITHRWWVLSDLALENGSVRDSGSSGAAGKRQLQDSAGIH